MRQWMVAAKKADFYAIAEKFHVDPVVARIIRNREVIGEKNIRIYLGGNLSDLSDPHQMKDMDRLGEILVQKIRKQVHIRIIGDYDVDGVTSSHLFLTALRRVGAKVDVVIPHRIQDGYGLSLHLLQQAKEDGVDTILTCDNGIAAIDEIAWAKAQKMTVLVTDHHAVPFEEHEGRRTEKKSLADAVVNPHQQDCGYPYKELCGAGVAWNVIRVLYENYDMDKREAEDLLDFVAMATVCDVMSLTGENRILVKEGLKRIRFMTSHPKDLSDDLILAMKECDKVCKHMHLPLQSGSSRILKIMNRHYDKEQYLTIVKKLREAIPDIALTTDIIVGFPGETEEDFQETLEVVKQVEYDSAFTFIYSKRTGTPAATMDDQIPEEVIKERFDRLLHEVQTISAEKAGKLTGQTLPVLVEEVNGQDASLVTGKLTNNSTVHFPGTADMIGTIQNVVLEECKGFYYIGRLA